MRFIPLSEDRDEEEQQLSFIPLEAAAPEPAAPVVDEAAEAQAARDSVFAGRRRRQAPAAAPTDSQPGLVGQAIGDLVDTVTAPFRPERSVMDPLKNQPRSAPKIESRGGPVTEEYAEGVRRGMELSGSATRDAAVEQEGVRGNVARTQRAKVEAAENSPSKTVREIGGGLQGRTRGYIAQGEDARVARVRAMSDIVAGRIGSSIESADVPYDEAISDTIARRALDLGLSAAQIPAEVVRGIADITQLATAGLVGGDLSAGMTEANRKLQAAKSTGAQIQDAEFQRLMESSTANGGTVLNYLLNNPGLLLEKALPSAGSMALPIAGASLAGRIASTARYLQALPAAERAAKIAQIQEAVVVATGTAQNAAEAFTSTKGDLGDKYSAAAIAGIGSLLAGKVTGGGVEGAIVRGEMGGLRGAAARVAGGAKIVGREFGQEFGEGFSTDIGQQFGETGTIDPRAAAKTGVVEGAMGAVIGGGMAGVNAMLPERAPQQPQQQYVPIIDAANVAPGAPAPTIDVPTARAPAPSATSFTPPDSLSAQVGLTPIVVPNVSAAPAVEGKTAPVGTVNPEIEREFGLDALRMPGAAQAVTPAAPAATAEGDRNISVPQPAAATPSTEPASVWFGRRGDGYATEADAAQALPGREKREPTLDWRVETMPSGKYRLAGYTVGEQDRASSASPAAAAAAAPTTTQQSAGAPATRAGEPVTVDLYRGVPAGRDPASTEGTVGEARFMSPDQAVAQTYAGEGGQVAQERVTFNNLLTAPTWAAAKQQLGLPRSATMQDLVEAARVAGHDGVSFTTTNGVEYVQIPQEVTGGRGTAAAGTGVAGAAPASAGGGRADAVGGNGDAAAGLALQTPPVAGAPAVGGAGADDARRDIVQLQDYRLKFNGEAVTFEVVAPEQNVNANLATRIAQRFKAPITFVRARTGRTTMEAVRMPSGRLILNAEADAPGVALAMHEVGHGLDRDLRQKLISSVLPTLKADARERFLKEFPGYGRLSLDKQDEELVMRAIEQDAQNPGFWRKVAEKMGDGEFAKLAKEILNSLDRILAGFRREDSSEFVRDIQAFRDAVASVYAEADQRINADEALPAAPDGDVNFSTRRPSLARRLQERGEYAESKADARRMLEEGYEMYVAHEMDERPVRVRRPEQFEGYQPEQIIGIRPDSEPMASDQRVGNVDTHVLNAARGVRKIASRTTVSAEERAAIATAAKKLKVDAADIEAIVRDHKAAHPTSDGWAPLVFSGAEVDEDNGKISVQYQAVPYDFNQGKNGKALKPGTADYAAKVGRLGRGMVDEVRAVFVRAQGGEQAAKNIIAQSGWYKQMRTRLRQEFGGLGDLFADLLGATSPNTPVRTNWDNSVEALRLATQGEFDALMPRWVAFFDNVDAVETEARAFFNDQIAQGLKKNAIKKLPEFNAFMARLKVAREFPDELLPLKSNGKKFGFNGYNVVRAMVDLWRVVKNADPDIGRGGTAPKAINFSGNLIGFRARATIDVWAARMLQRLAGGARIPSMAENGVTGEALEDGANTLQFGFGQDVFSDAVGKIRRDPQLSADPVLSSINDDDLQALVWFIEKEVWTINNWTSAAGEGGSFEFESDLAGIRDRERVIELRKKADTSVASTPEEREQATKDIARLTDAMANFPAIVAQERLIAANKARVTASKAEKDRKKKLTPKEIDEIRAANAEARAAMSRARRSPKYVAMQKELTSARGVLKKLTQEERQAERAKAVAELKEMSRTVDRYVLGVTVQRDRPATDAEMAELARQVREAAVAGDPGATVIGLKAIASEGWYGTTERALDAEVITRDGYDARPLAIATFKAANEAKQDSAFVARVLRPTENVDYLRHRPGIEIYFRDMAQAEEAARMMSEIVGMQVGVATNLGPAVFQLGGYTIIVDGRNTPATRAGERGTPVGMRVLYMPEYEARYGDTNPFDGASDDAIRDIVADRARSMRAFADAVMRRYPEVSFSGRFNYEVEARFAGEYERAIDAYADADAGAGTDRVGGGPWKGRSVRESVASATGRDAVDGSQPGAELSGGDTGGAEPLASERRGAGPAEPAGRSGAVGDGRDGRAFSRQPPRADAVEVTGVHYGKFQVGSLSGRQYGTGIKGAEAERLALSGDARIKRRVYFYLHDPASDALPTPEQGLGAHVYRQRLGNLYDPAAASDRVIDTLAAARQRGPNAFESAILDAGFDGYVSRQFGMAVVLNADVPVEYLGTRQELNIRKPAGADAPRRVKLGLLSAEIREAEAQMDALRAAAPSVELRNGSLLFNEADRDAVAGFFPRAGAAQPMASERRDAAAADEAIALVKKARDYQPEEGEDRVVFPILFHSGTGDPASLARGVEPQFGSWVTEVLEGASDETVNADESFVPLSYFASVPEWITMQTARKLGKERREVTLDDVRKHGQLAIVYNVDERFGDAKNKVFQIGPDGYNGGYTEVTDVYGRKRKLYETGLEEEGDYRSGPKTLFGVEPGDIITKDSIEPDVVLTGDALVAFMRKYRNEIDPSVDFSERRDAQQAAASPFSGWGRVSKAGKPAIPRPSLELTKLVEQLDEGKIGSDEFEMKVRMLTGRVVANTRTKRNNREGAERVRGADIVREKLLAARRREQLDDDDVEFAMWLLGRKPELADDLGASVRTPKADADGVSGRYNPAARIIFLFKQRTNPDTTVHEILHHTERMMPGPVQDGIAAEWARQFARAYVQAQGATRGALDDIVQQLVSASEAGQRKVVDHFSNGRLDYEQHYQLVNPSEFWAVNATRILSGRYKTQGSWVGAARVWLREMLQKARGLLGLASDAPVLRGLEDVLKGNAAFVSKAMLSERLNNASDMMIEVKRERDAQDMPSIYSGPMFSERRAPSEAEVRNWNREQLVTWLQEVDPNFVEPQPDPEVELMQTARGWLVTGPGDYAQDHDTYEAAFRDYQDLRYEDALPLTEDEARDAVLAILRQQVWPEGGAEVVVGRFGGRGRASNDEPAASERRSDIASAIERAADPADDVVSIFDGLAAKGLRLERAQEALAEHPMADTIRRINDDFLDILGELEESGALLINC